MKRKFHAIVSCAAVTALVASLLTVPGNSSAPNTAKAATAPDTVAYSNPARVSVHDPSIAVSKEGVYYVFGSHIDAAKSTDMVNWEHFTNGYTTPNNTLFGNLATNLKVPFTWAGSPGDANSIGYSVWAPDVFWNERYVNKDGSKGAYMMYFCTSSTAIRSCIAFAVSQNIEGPYTYVDTLVYSGFTKTSTKENYKNTNIPALIDNGTLKDGLNANWFNGNSYNNSYAPNAIDPEIVEDTEGKLWMSYGSWSGGIYLLEIDPATGRAIYPGENKTFEDEKDTRLVDSYFGIRIAGGYTKSGEGPYIIYDKESGYYYLYVSYNYLDSKSGYNMRLFRSKSPQGPYLDAAGNNAALPASGYRHDDIGIRVMGNYTMPCLGRGYLSAGHNSALIDTDGERYLIYHQRFESRGEIHEVRVHQQFLNEEGWPVTAVYENKGDRISKTGYSKDAIVGDYYFINHGLDSQGSTFHSPKNVVLNADGKISGAATGTWEEKEGSYYAKFVIGGVTYSGVFFEQLSEESQGKKVMTFTAIGTNNQTIWGSKRPVELSSSRSTIYCGGDMNKTAQLSIKGSSTVPFTVTYKSSKPSVASVNAKGVVTAKKAGKAKITATYKTGSLTKTFTKTITVKKAYLKFKKSKSSMKVGKSYTFTVKGYGIKAKPITWKSSKKKVLTVGKKNGKVKAKKVGTATVTASYKKIKVSKKVKVKAAKKKK